MLINLVKSGEGLMAGLEPKLLLINPGSKLDDPDDDIAIGLILANGTYTYFKPTLVSTLQDEVEILPLMESALMDKVYVKTRDLLMHENYKLQYAYHTDTHGFKKSQLSDSRGETLAEPITITGMRSESIVNKRLRSRSNPSLGNDLRLVYSVRYNFEDESYERLRFEISKLLQKDLDLKTQIIGVLEKPSNINAKREELRQIIKGTDGDDENRGLLADLIVRPGDVDGLTERLENSLGPLNCGFK